MGRERFRSAFSRVFLVAQVLLETSSVQNRQRPMHRRPEHVLQLSFLGFAGTEPARWTVMRWRGCQVA